MNAIWVIEDHRRLRDTVREALAVAECGPVATFADCESAIRAAGRGGEPPAVILLDLGLPGMSGLAGLREFKTLLPRTEIVVFTVCDDRESVFEAIRAGASGYLLKSEPVARIVAAVREVQAGGAPMTPEVARRVLVEFQEAAPPSAEAAGGGPPPAAAALSDRELDVLRLLAEGLVKKEVASHLGLSPHTVDNYIRRIYAKLHVNTIGAAVARAVRDGMV